jgi:hypothetical protein
MIMSRPEKKFGGAFGSSEGKSTSVGELQQESFQTAQ